MIRRSINCFKQRPFHFLSPFSSTLKFRSTKPVQCSFIPYSLSTPHPHREQWPTPLPHQSIPTVCIRKTNPRKKHPASRYLHLPCKSSSSFPPFLIRFPPSIQVFAGNLAYSVNDEGLKAFFAPVQGDMYVLFSSFTKFLTQPLHIFRPQSRREKTCFLHLFNHDIYLNTSLRSSLFSLAFLPR